MLSHCLVERTAKSCLHSKWLLSHPFMSCQHYIASVHEEHVMVWWVRREGKKMFHSSVSLSIILQHWCTRVLTYNMNVNVFYKLISIFSPPNVYNELEKIDNMMMMCLCGSVFVTIERWVTHDGFATHRRITLCDAMLWALPMSSTLVTLLLSNLLHHKSLSLSFSVCLPI